MVCPGDEIASIYSLTPNMRKTLDSKPPATPLNSWGTSAPEHRKVTTLAGQGLVRWLLAVWWPRGAGKTDVQPELAGGHPHRLDVLHLRVDSGFYVLGAVSVGKRSACVVPSR